jgi:hypothetical protein
VSTFDKGKSFDVEDAFKQLVEFLNTYSVGDKGLEQKTEFSGDQPSNFTRVEYKDKIMRDEFGVNTHLTEMVSKSMMRKKISNKGNGKTNVYQAISMQLDRLMRKRGSLEGLLPGGSNE